MEKYINYIFSVWDLTKNSIITLLPIILIFLFFVFRFLLSFFIAFFISIFILILSYDKLSFLKNKIQIIFENLKEINNDLKFIRSQIILASFFLILIKIIFPTTICIRIFLLFFFIIGSTYFNLRKKAQFLIKKILFKLLSDEKVSFNIDTLDIWDFKRIWESRFQEKMPVLLEFLKKIDFLDRFFKIKQALNSFFFHVLGISNFLRFIIDRNKLLYLFSYGFLVFIVVFSNQGIFLSFFGLIINLNYLFFYLSDDNYSELLEKIAFDNPNLISSEKKIKICYQNMIIINLLSIRDVGKIVFHLEGDLIYEYYEIEDFIKSHIQYHEYFFYDFSDRGLDISLPIAYLNKKLS